MKGLFAVALAAAGTAVAHKNIVPSMEYEFRHFVEDFERDYIQGTAEWFEREAIFLKNRFDIMEQNIAYKEGRSGWHAAVNKFGDRTSEEMQKLRGYKVGMGRRARDQNLHAKINSRARADLPSSIDWRTKGVMTPPKDQGGCGSCWAFASTETLESHVAINTGKLLELAPQQYVNCASNPHKCGGTGGCEGATAEVAFNYTAVHGLPLESDVPYHARDGLCNHHAAPAATATGYHELKMNDEDELMQAIANVGPVSISVAAKSWGFYFGGVFDGPNGDGCDAEVDHAVQLVGYGTEGARTDYWLVRNSWGGSWGETGYIRIARHPGNEPCKVDPNPADGICGTGPCACPDTVTYCGTCAILSDSVLPTGAGLA